MDLSEVLEKQKRYEAARDTFPEMTIASYEKAFELEDRQLNKYLSHVQRRLT